MCFCDSYHGYHYFLTITVHLFHHCYSLISLLYVCMKIMYIVNYISFCSKSNLGISSRYFHVTHEKQSTAQIVLLKLTKPYFYIPQCTVRCFYFYSNLISISALERDWNAIWRPLDDVLLLTHCGRVTQYASLKSPSLVPTMACRLFGAKPLSVFLYSPVLQSN